MIGKWHLPGLQAGGEDISGNFVVWCENTAGPAEEDREGSAKDGNLHAVPLGHTPLTAGAVCSDETSVSGYTKKRRPVARDANPLAREGRRPTTCATSIRDGETKHVGPQTRPGLPQRSNEERKGGEREAACHTYS